MQTLAYSFQVWRRLSPFSLGIHRQADTLCFTQKNRHGNDHHSGGFLSLRLLRRVRHRTEPGMSDGYVIGPDGLLLRRHIEKWELHQPFDLMLALIGSIRRQMPEEQPLIGAEVK
jgi:hypothetical protein